MFANFLLWLKSLYLVLESLNAISEFYNKKVQSTSLVLQLLNVWLSALKTLNSQGQTGLLFFTSLGLSIKSFDLHSQICDISVGLSLFLNSLSLTLGKLFLELVLFSENSLKRSKLQWYLVQLLVLLVQVVYLTPQFLNSLSQLRNDVNLQL